MCVKEEGRIIGKYVTYIGISVLLTKYCSDYKIKSRKIRWDEHKARTVNMRGLYTVFVGKRNGKKPLSSPSRRCDYTIKKDIKVKVWTRLRIGTGGGHL
jgi:hypothetical protein